MKEWNIRLVKPECDRDSLSVLRILVVDFSDVRFERKRMYRNYLCWNEKIDRMFIEKIIPIGFEFLRVEIENVGCNGIEKRSIVGND